MQVHRFALVAALIASFTQLVDAAVRYVNANNANPIAPYTNWATAATIIQEAVDAALPGDEIVVTNGVYQTGGRALYFGMTNRVAVTKPIMVRSINGPDVTVIRGYQVPATTNGNGAVRCVYLTNGATLAGFTLTSGAVMGRVPLGPSGLPALTLPSDGHEFLSGGGVWCDSRDTVVSNCVLAGNSAAFGGGAFWGTLNCCKIVGNIAGSGGGTVRSVLNDCVLSGNSAERGGGAHFAALTRCVVTGNSAESGGGVSRSALTSCTVSGNTSTSVGGGVLSSVLYNCVLIGNAAQFGGGAYGCNLNNCTVVGNAASSEGGGIWAFSRTAGGFRGCDTIGCFPQPECSRCISDQGIVNGAIVYDNTAPEGPNHSGVIRSG